MKPIIYYFVFFIATSWAMVSCGTKSTEVKTQEHHSEPEGIVELTEAQFTIADIQFGKVESKYLRSTIQVNGVLDVPPQNMVSVSAMMGGFIQSTELLQGLKVEKGQIIATIQNPDFIKIQSNYLENKSRLVFLEQEFKREEELSRENVTSIKALQQVTSEYNSLQATVGALEEQLKILQIDPTTLSRTTIRSSVNLRSPINGYVIAVNVNIGKYVLPQDVICEIVDTDHLHAELTVFEKDIAKIRKGQTIRLLLVNENGKERTASVYLINRQISQERTIRVHAHLDKEDPNLMPNMYLTAFIEVGEGNKTTALSEGAIMTVGDKFYIFIKSEKEAHSQNGKEGNEKQEEEHAFQSIEIQKGVTQNGFTEVILPKGFDIDRADVVVKGAYALLTKMNNEEEGGHTH